MGDNRAQTAGFRWRHPGGGKDCAFPQKEGGGPEGKKKETGNDGKDRGVVLAWTARVYRGDFVEKTGCLGREGDLQGENRMQTRVEGRNQKKNIGGVRKGSGMLDIRGREE